jgi:hypothetical protein
LDFAVEVVTGVSVVGWDESPGGVATLVSVLDKLDGVDGVGEVNADCPRDDSAGKQITAMANTRRFIVVSLPSRPKSKQQATWIGRYKQRGR